MRMSPVPLHMSYVIDQTWYIWCIVIYDLGKFTGVSRMSPVTFLAYHKHKACGIWKVTGVTCRSPMPFHMSYVIDKTRMSPVTSNILVSIYLASMVTPQSMTYDIRKVTGVTRMSRVASSFYSPLLTTHRIMSSIRCDIWYKTAQIWLDDRSKITGDTCMTPVTFHTSYVIYQISYTSSVTNHWHTTWSNTVSNNRQGPDRGGGDDMPQAHTICRPLAEARGAGRVWTLYFRLSKIFLPDEASTMPTSTHRRPFSVRHGCVSGLPRNQQNFLFFQGFRIHGIPALYHIRPATQQPGHNPPNKRHKRQTRRQTSSGNEWEPGVLSMQTHNKDNNSIFENLSFDRDRQVEMWAKA